MDWSWILLGALAVFGIAAVLLAPSRYSSASSNAAGSTVQVVVLGDIGRSPRMQYHAISLAKHGHHVDIIGYKGSKSRLPSSFLQNPPSIPTLLVAHIVCLLRNTTLCIDWHNFGHSILALKLGPKHPLVQISEKYEYAVSRTAPVNFTVTDAMARVLPDEDFSILLDALAGYSAAATVRDLPTILAVITGKGPQKEHYLSRIAAMESGKKLERVRIRTAWLTMEDYAAMLSYADLGVSLHMSSSGVDLPMKVVDMFGAGLPVVGWSQFEAWPELVKEGINGKGFGSSAELRELLLELFTRNEALSELREGALKECKKRWDDEWDEKAGKIFR
ncbi:putative beta- -mannosyltransferase protein [Neofusicoccum parvum UCRNP2]|uniref:Chitobiosyldiphosphodolichol beta-mannosyltransferase n=1 Tax=Botryosphaeria parva (strain UCR-NP2) TaxID=1287680 RepID=R1GD55_BOTPV|nr:putative beta- -mannosyltransferase protein [Neofusicoccum parvum UCRNP2]